jgi:hypothetical protein
MRTNAIKINIYRVRVYAYDTILYLPSTKDSEGPDKETKVKKKNEKKMKEREREKLTYNCIRRIATNINIRWHL